MFCLSLGVKQFVYPPGDNHFFHTVEWGHTYLPHRREGGPNIFHTGGQTFYVGGGGTYDDVVEELVVSEANFLLSEASNLSAGARALKF